MATRRDLIDAFNDSVDRLAAGESVSDCLRRYPQFTRQLQPMLEIVQLTQRISSESAAEFMPVQGRMQERVLDELKRRPLKPRRVIPFGSLAGLARVAAGAAVALVVVLVILSQNSLPGDPLYGVKRFAESVQYAFSPNEETIETQEERRVQEIRALLDAGREEIVSFTGTLDSIGVPLWIVAGLPVRVEDPNSAVIGLTVGERVSVSGFTTAAGELVATSVRPDTPADPPTATPTATPTLTPTPTATPAAPSGTSTELVGTPPAPGNATPTPFITLIFGVTHTPEGGACVPTQPPGWMVYTIQPDDRLLDLLTLFRLERAQIVRANCIDESADLAVGVQLYLPNEPGALRTAIFEAREATRTLRQQRIIMTATARAQRRSP